MTTSASTPRLRRTQAYYGALVIASAVAGPQAATPRLSLILNAAALLCVSAAVLGRIWCSAFIAGRKDVELVTSGPYSLCRHPLYTLSMLGGLGLGTASQSLVLGALTLAVLAAQLTAAARSEEAFLAQRHGAAFEAYAARTPRFWPSGRQHIPATLQVNPAVLWKAFVDAGSFFLLLALIEAARSLRQAGLLPTLLPLP
jgi:protein-S-isoprenylcysteine O-methyltransferase Ste14